MATRVKKRRVPTKRIVADVPARVYVQMRLRCVEQGILIRDYILKLLAKDGIE